MTKQEKSWILYDVANSAYVLVVITAVLPIFYKNVAAKHLDGAVATANWGFANSITYILIALFAPILGTFADYEGKRKTFFRFFLILGLFSTILLVTVGEGDWIKCLLLFVQGGIGFSGANIFYDAFLVDVTSHERMDWISSNGFAWGYIGATVPFLLGMIVIQRPGVIGADSQLTATRTVFVLTAVWWFVFSIPLIRNVKQLNYIESSLRPVKDSFERLFSTIRDLKKHKNAFVFMIAYFFYIDGVDTIIRMATVYGVDIGLSSETLLLVILIVQVVAFPFALLYGALAERYSAKKMLLAGIGVYIVIIGMAYYLPALPTLELKTAMFFALAMLVATSQGGIQALSRSYFGRLIPKENAAEFFGFYNIFGKFAVIVGPFLMGFTTRLTGQPKFGILSLMTLLLAGGVILLNVKEASVNLQNG
jgi:UMF1 family MFS transporter